MNQLTRFERINLHLQTLKKAYFKRCNEINEFFPFIIGVDVCCQSCKYGNDEKYKKASERIEKIEKEIATLTQLVKDAEIKSVPL